MTARSLRRRLALIAAAAASFAALVSAPRAWEAFLGALYPDAPRLLYERTGLATLTAQHVALVATASVLVVLAGVPLGLWVTRPSGRDFKRVVEAAVDLGQTFPPVAVLVLAVPALDAFGFLPTVTALFVYGLFPVVSNTIAGIESVPGDTVDAARGIGMGPWQVLARVELPLAVRVILAGVRTSTIVAVGTATLGATVGAGGLGVPIIAGLVQRNLAYITEGALAAALLALLIDAALETVEDALALRSGTEAGGA
ncbi:MAG: ABC transporter permease [Coriobacteriia bacterium]|nr:ABC transporter permease [Coriobacteriia bacterium]